MVTISTNRNDAVLLRTIALMLCCIMCCSIFVMGNTSLALCAPTDPTNSVAEDIGGAVEDVTENIYSTMRKVVIPICIVVIAAAGFYFVLGGSQGTEKARKVIIGAVIFLVLVVFAPVIGKSLGDMFSEQGAGEWGSYNPLK